VCDPCLFTPCGLVCLSFSYVLSKTPGCFLWHFLQAVFGQRSTCGDLPAASPSCRPRGYPAVGSSATGCLRVWLATACSEAATAAVQWQVNDSVSHQATATCAFSSTAMAIVPVMWHLLVVIVTCQICCTRTTSDSSAGSCLWQHLPAGTGQPGRLSSSCCTLNTAGTAFRGCWEAGVGWRSV